MTSVLAVHYDPFAMSPHVYAMPPGTSLAEMVACVTSLPEGWPRHENDVIAINGHPVPQPLWSMIRPKPAANSGLRNLVSFHAPPEGGDDVGKQIVSAVASLALITLSGGIAGGAILGGLTGATIGAPTLFSRLLGFGVLALGSTALAALAPTPTLPQLNRESGTTQAPGIASAQGNVLEPNTPLTRVVGLRKVFPEYVTEPFTYYDAEDEVVEVVAALAGPHQLNDISIEDALVADMPLVEVETREGWPGEAPLTLINRYARTIELRSELRGHTVRDDAPRQLESQTDDIDDARPQPKVMTTRVAPDEFWIGLNFPQGISLNASATDQLRIPFRLRIREKGTDTWHNLPELHYKNAHLGEKRATIKLVWRDGHVPPAGVSTAVGWVEARILAPGQTLDPVSADYAAHADFDAGSGDDYANAANVGATAVRNVVVNPNVAEISLNTASFPRGQYEVELIRGYAFRDISYAAAGYTLGGVVRDFFGYETSAALIQQTKEGLADKCFVVRHSSVRNAPPVRGGDVALIALKARNTAVTRLSALAGGYVRDWDGSGWTDWKVSSNPAPHLRDVLGGLLNARPVPEDIIDDTMLTDWRDDGFECNAIIRGMSVGEAARLICGTGYARLYGSEVWGVLRDRDRTADAPVQIFNDHNSANFKWAKAFANLPDGIRATFVDRDRNYESRQIIHPPGASITEQVTIEGIVDEAQLRARLDYDLAVPRARGTLYTWEAPAEAIVCRRGSLVGVQAGMLSAHTGSGRVVRIEYDAAGLVTAVWLDSAPPVLSAPAFDAIADLSAVEDMSLIGLRSGLVLRRSGGAHSVHKVSPDSDGARIVVETPFAPDGLTQGDLAALGPYQTELRRLIVTDMKPRRGVIWTIAAVAEAPELFA